MIKSALEVLYGGKSPSEDVSQQARSRLQQIVGDLSHEIIVPGDVPTFPRDADNTALFLAGEHGGLRVTKPVR